MNEVITKLNEIEEKAGAILAEAGERKKAMAEQFEKDKCEIDRKYDKLLEENITELEKKLRGEAEREFTALKSSNTEALERLEHAFAEQKENLTKTIVAHVIQ